MTPQGAQANSLPAEDRVAHFRGDILAQVSEAVLTIGEDRRLTFLNAAAERLYGTKAAEALGREVAELFQTVWLPPDSEETVIATLRAGGVWRGENIHLTRAGETIHVESSLSLLPAKEGEPAGLLAVIRDVTERHRAEAALHASAEQLRLIADTAPVLIAHCDLEHRYKFVNAPYAGRLGLRREDVIGKKISEVIGEKAYAAIREYIERVLAGEAVEFDITLPYEKLGNHHMRCAYEPERNAAGEVIGLVGAIVDITERMRVEEKLRENQARLQFTLEAAQVGDWDLDLTTDTSRRSLRHDQAFGYAEPVAEWGFEKFMTHVHPDDREEVARKFHESVSKLHDWHFECRVIWPDETEHWIAAHGSIFRAPDGAPTRMLGIVSDVTDRKNAEDALRQNEALFSKIIEQAPGGVYVVDDQFCTLKVNALARPTFAAAEPVIGREFGEVMRILWGPEIGTQLSEIFRHTLETGERYASPRFTGQREDLGEQRSYDWETQRLILPNGKCGVVCYFTDTTEQIRQEGALREAKEVAEAASASKDRFLAVLSHELRTPLTPVLMAVTELGHDGTLRPEVREDLAMVKRNIELETKLIDDLLDLSRITTGKLELRLEAIDLNGAVRHVCESCRSQLQERHVHLETAFAEDAGDIPADSARLQQVLWNVLRNAIKFTPGGGRIFVSTRRLAGKRCEVRVRDSGIGISGDVLPLIFDAFEQGNPQITRQFGGLGLGLAICKALVERHGGTIRAESAGQSQGATFVIEFPSLTETVPQTKPPPAPADVGTAEIVRLLVVEDHADTARTLQRLLVRAGFAVATAVDVASGLAAAERGEFDILVSDLGLPDGSGCELMRRVRALRPIPGIAMSGFGMDEDIRRSREAGFLEHLVKPIEVPQLIAAIRRVTAGQLVRKKGEGSESQ